MADSKTTEAHLRKHLASLTIAVKEFLSKLDAEMAKPSSHERGRRIAGMASSLEFCNDWARHFGLGIDLAKFVGKRAHGRDDIVAGARESGARIVLIDRDGNVVRELPLAERETDGSERPGG